MEGKGGRGERVGERRGTGEEGTGDGRETEREIERARGTERRRMRGMRGRRGRGGGKRELDGRVVQAGPIYDDGDGWWVGGLTYRAVELHPLGVRADGAPLLLVEQQLVERCQQREEDHHIPGW